MSDERRIRLLAIVESDFVPVYAHHPTRPYQVATGDHQWFQDNIPCQAACPAHTDVPRYIGLIADGRYADSYALNREYNVFPGCLGRICARPCEDACRRGVVDAPVSICSLKRSAADLSAGVGIERVAKRYDRSVAIVGAGPAGLAAARDLAQAGLGVSVFERHPVPGGMLWAGIPSWRLPKKIIREEVRAISDLGVEIRYNTALGRDLTLDELLDDFDAVLLAVGCQTPTLLGIPGEDLPSVESGLAFLERVNLQRDREPLTGQRVLTIGGGYTSIDCVRSTQRMGAAASLLAYRRDRQSIPVSEEELREAEAEGVEFLFMASPVRIIGHDGTVTGVEFIRNELSTDASTGRTRLEPIAGSEFVVACERVIVAVGQQADRGLVDGELLGQLDRRGVPVVDDSLCSEHPRVWVAGDYLTNPTNVITAVASGRRAAASIERYLLGTDAGQADPSVELTNISAPEQGLLLDLMAQGAAEWSVTTLDRRLRRGDNYIETPRQVMPLLPVSKRGLGTSAPAHEVELGFEPALSFEEAKRCLQCQLNIFIDGSSCILCNGCVEVCPQHCIEMVPLQNIGLIDNDPLLTHSARQECSSTAMTMVIDETACIRCGRCVERCPTGCLTMDHVHTVDHVPLATGSAAR